MAKGNLFRHVVGGHHVFLGSINISTYLVCFPTIYVDSHRLLRRLLEEQGLPVVFSAFSAILDTTSLESKRPHTD